MAVQELWANLHRLRAKIAHDFERMLTDCAAYGNDRAILKEQRASDPPASIPWHKSHACKLLKMDVDNDKEHKELLKPADLYTTREEYHAFTLKLFQNHLYQEVDSRAKRAYKYEKKKNRNNAPAASSTGI